MSGSPSAELTSFDSASDNLHQTELFSDFLLKRLASLGIQVIFGVSGGGVAKLWTAMERSQIPFIHCRHEAGASFAAMEAFFETQSPAAILTTTGPGITNALTGLFAAKYDGAKVLLISGYTPKIQRGKGSTQETTSDSLLPGIFENSSLFDYATVIESIEQWPVIERHLAAGFAKPNHFIAHISIPPEVQSVQLVKKLYIAESKFLYGDVVCSDDVLQNCMTLLKEGPFAIWVGYGARHASKELQVFVEKTGCAVFCSPSAKGIFPEDHEQYIGISGLGGHASVLQYLRDNKPNYILVLGTSLAETTSFWNPEMTPRKSFIHIDINPQVPGLAYPDTKIIGIQSEIKMFLSKLISLCPVTASTTTISPIYKPQITSLESKSDLERVNPTLLFEAIQNIIVMQTDALIMAESGNAFAWTTHILRFSKPNRYRISSLWGSMGHFAAGVIGAAHSNRRKVIAIVGDGAMLMLNELSTAIKYNIPAVWIILNDGCYNMCRQGIQLLDNTAKVETKIPETNFAAFSQAMGGKAFRIEKNSDLSLLENILIQEGPIVFDVVIDPEPLSPFMGRVNTLAKHIAFKE